MALPKPTQDDRGNGITTWTYDLGDQGLVTVLADTQGEADANIQSNLDGIAARAAERPPASIAVTVAAAAVAAIAAVTPLTAAQRSAALAAALGAAAKAAPDQAAPPATVT